MKKIAVIGLGPLGGNAVNVLSREYQPEEVQSGKTSITKLKDLMPFHSLVVDFAGPSVCFSDTSDRLLLKKKTVKTFMTEYGMSPFQTVNEELAGLIRYIEKSHMVIVVGDLLDKNIFPLANLVAILCKKLQKFSVGLAVSAGAKSDCHRREFSEAVSGTLEMIFDSLFFLKRERSDSHGVLMSQRTIGLLLKLFKFDNCGLLEASPQVIKDTLLRNKRPFLWGSDSICKTRLPSAIKDLFEKSLTKEEIQSKRSIVLLYRGGKDMTLTEMSDTQEEITEHFSPDVKVDLSVAFDESIKNEIEIIVLAV